MKHLALQWRIALAVLALGITACGGDLTLPGPGLALEVVQGNGQQGTVGEELPSVVVVQVKSDEGSPLPGQRIVFSSDDSTDAFEPETAVTDAAGKAFTRWVLGTEPGTYAGEARLVAEGDSTVTAEQPSRPAPSRAIPTPSGRADPRLRPPTADSRSTSRSGSWSWIAMAIRWRARTWCGP